MKGITFEQHLVHLREAVKISGDISKTDLAALIKTIREDPNTIPQQDRLWPVFSYVRACIIGDVPPEWLDEDTLAQVIESREILHGNTQKIRNANTYPKASIEEREAAIDGHLLRVHSICPYARKAASQRNIEYIGLPEGFMENPRMMRGQLQSAVESFVQDGKKRVLILVFGDNFPNHDVAHVASKKAFMEFAVASGKLAAPQLSYEELEELQREMHPRAFTTNHTKIETPLVPFRNTSSIGDKDTFFVFAANNLYNPEHPRYTPYPALVATYNEDLVAAIRDEPHVGARITMNALAGIAYEHMPHVSIKDLRAGMESELLVVDGVKQGFSTGSSRIPPELQALIAMSYRKSFYELPLSKEIVGKLCPHLG